MLCPYCCIHCVTFLPTCIFTRSKSQDFAVLTFCCQFATMMLICQLFGLWCNRSTSNRYDANLLKTDIPPIVAELDILSAINQFCSVLVSWDQYSKPMKWPGWATTIACVRKRTDWTHMSNSDDVINRTKVFTGLLNNRNPSIFCQRSPYVEVGISTWSSCW